MKRAVNICAGAGGSSLGQHQAGFDVVQAVEIDDDAWAAHEAGLPGAQRIADLRDAVGKLSAPYWWASPPCQPFSAAGRRDGAQDDRDLFPVLLDVIRAAKAQGRGPLWVAVENVKGLTFHRSAAWYKKHKQASCRDEGAAPRPDVCPGCYLAKLRNDFRALFPFVEARVLNCADFGLPQSRERLVIQASMTGPINWPRPTHSEEALALVKHVRGQTSSLARSEIAALHRIASGESNGAEDLLPWVTIRQALGQVWVRHQSPSGETHQREGAFNPAYHKVVGGGGNPHHPGDKRTYRELTDTPSTTITAQAGGGAGNAGPFVQARLGPEPERLDRPSTTVMTTEVKGTRGEHMRKLLPSGKVSGGLDRTSDHLYLATGRRRLTVEECAVLQGFPRDWPFHGTKTAKYRQVGNAVPPVLARVVSEHPPNGFLEVLNE